MPEPAKPSTWNAFVATLKRVDKSKINSKWMAARNAIAVALPLSVGSFIGNALGAVAISTGALNVSYSDGRDPYHQRARRMLTWSVLGAFAVFVGSSSGKYHVAAIVLTAAWAFIGGMCVAVSTRAGDLGLNTLVAVIIFAARGALSPLYAFYAALLVLGGGLLQTGLALLFWPVHRYEPERRAIAAAYNALADEIDPSPNTPALSPASAPTQQVQDTLAALGRENNPEDARLRILFDQADRIRISVFLLDRLRTELQQSQLPNIDSSGALACIDDLRNGTAKLVRYVAGCLLAGESASTSPGELTHVEQIADCARKICSSGDSLGAELISAVNALLGQLRGIARLAGYVIPEGLEAAARHESAQPRRLQVANWIATMRVNFDRRSPVFRHAVRLAVCVALGDAISRSIRWQRSYWIPMTIAVVLKPDFASTFSRGVLRLIGTFAGLGLATVLYGTLPRGPLTECALTGIFTFALRYIGPANYGVFSVAISGLIVFELSAAGTPAEQVVITRALSTAAGGFLALIAYALWPTWERRKIADVLADMIDAGRAYFHAVVERFTRDDDQLQDEVDRARREFRRTRSDASASVDRAAAEPGTPPEKIALLSSMMAHSLALFSGILGLEAGVGQNPVHTTPEAFRKFATDVEMTLYFLSASLRGSASAANTLPKLRDDYERMLESRDAFSPNDQFVLLETDRLTTALNTLREQTMRYLQ
ncbi:MAG: FUSC family protein [Acidobacteriaceae bacterium]|nr:FUSC family protein [Acidobacteriaceae bacterium]